MLDKATYNRRRKRERFRLGKTRGGRGQLNLLDVARGHAALFKIALMVFLGAVKRAGRGNLRGDRPRESLAGIESGFGFFGDRFLLGRVCEDCRAVLRAIIGTLAIHLRWIVHVPEGVNQGFITDLSRVEGHLNNLGVAGVIGANVFIGRVLRMAVAVADGGVNNSRDHAKLDFDSPEAAGSKGSGFSHVIPSFCQLHFNSNLSCLSDALESQKFRGRGLLPGLHVLLAKGLTVASVRG
jgi:hypothetical protein